MSARGAPAPASGRRGSRTELRATVWAEVHGPIGVECVILEDGYGAL